MQIIDCEKCISLLQDYFDRELTPDMQDAVRIHLAGCENCSDFYGDFEQLSMLMRQTSAADLPKALALDVKSIIKAAEKRTNKRRVRQWTSIAAVFVVCVGSFFALNGELKNFFNGENSEISPAGLTSVAEDQGSIENDAGLRDRSEDCDLKSAEEDEIQPEYGVAATRFELFDQALADPIFAADVNSLDLGYGYEVIESYQEEDGSTTFVIYFYEDETYAVKSLESTADYLLLSNVRSFNWAKSEL